MNVAISPAQMLIWVNGLATCYVDLYNSSDGLVDQRFEQPATTTLRLFERAIINNQHATYIVKRAIDTRVLAMTVNYTFENNHLLPTLWRQTLDQKPDVQLGLHQHISRAAEGLVNSGLLVVVSEEDNAKWVEQVLHRQVVAPLEAPSREASLTLIASNLMEARQLNDLRGLTRNIDALLRNGSDRAVNLVKDTLEFCKETLRPKVVDIVAKQGSVTALEILQDELARLDTRAYNRGLIPSRAWRSVSPKRRALVARIEGLKKKHGIR